MLILLTIYAIWIVIYYLFGNPDCELWSSFYFLFEALAMFFLFLNLKIEFQKYRLIINVFLVSSILDVLFNIVSLFFHKFTETINRGWELPFSIVIGILIFLIYDKRRKKNRRI